MKNRYEMQRSEKRSCSTDAFDGSSLSHYRIVVRYRPAGRAPVSRPRQEVTKSAGEKGERNFARIDEIGAAPRSTDVCVFSLHTVYCNIYVRHCNKNANSFVIRCFSSPARLPLRARAQANEEGCVNPSRADIVERRD